MLVQPATEVVAARIGWSPATRLGFRFAFTVAAFSWVRFKGLINSYLYFETLRAAANQWLQPVNDLEFRATRYLGALTIKMVAGGTVEHVAQKYYALCYPIAVLVTAAAIALVWSVADRRRTQYTTLNCWLRVYARYAVALVMMVYATVKLVPTQFGYITPGELLKPFGQLNRFWVLWNFMAVSTGYTIFAGLTEFLGAALLFFHRTTLLGARLLLASITNVFAIDIGYRVYGPAQVAGLLLVLVAVLLAPYTKPLVNVLVLGRADSMPAEPTTSILRWRYGPVAKVVVLTLLVSICVTDGIAQRRNYFGRRHAIYGMFDVDRFVRSGVIVTPLASDAKTWKRVATDGRYDSSRVSVQFANGDVKQYRLQEDTAKQEWTLRDGEADAAMFHYSIGADGFVSLEGRIANEAVQIYLRPVDLNSLPLFRTR